MTYITVTEVRNLSGAPTSLVTNTQISSFITIVEGEMERWLNAKFTPSQRIDVLDGNATQRIFTQKNPLLSVRALTVDTETVTPSTLIWKRPSGMVQLGSASECGVFINGTGSGVVIKYLHGFVDETSTSTVTTVVSTVGTNVALTVSSITDFADDDWVEIYGMDGHREAAQITGTPSGNTITVDQLVQTHSSGSTVVKVAIPIYVKEYMVIEAAICVALNAIGATYVFNSGYQLGDLNVQKGQPYVHWRESIQRLYVERDLRQGRIRPRPSIVV